MAIDTHSAAAIRNRIDRIVCIASAGNLYHDRSVHREAPPEPRTRCPLNRATTRLRALCPTAPLTGEVRAFARLSWNVSRWPPC
jgi:hypothetical protein